MLKMIYLISVNLSVLVCACEYIYMSKNEKKKKKIPQTSALTARLEVLTS
jgi:hypothetical protein